MAWVVLAPIVVILPVAGRQLARRRQVVVIVPLPVDVSLLY